MKTTNMKMGEIILLWAAGLWTALPSIALTFNDHHTNSELIWLVLASLPVWIFCGLLWITVYRRSTVKKVPSNLISSTEASDLIKDWLSRSLAAARKWVLESLALLFLYGVVYGLGGIILLGPVILIGYIVWPYLGHGVDVENLNARYKVFYLTDATWKMGVWKTVAVAGSVLAAYFLGLTAWARIFPYECQYCGQRYRKEKPAEECCVSNEPTWLWTWGHKLTTSLGGIL
jgi:hypothetical protein